MDFKDRLKLLIENKKVSPYKIWKETGIVHQSLMNYLSGKGIPGSNNLQKLAKYFEVSTDWLLTGLGDMRPDATDQGLILTENSANNVKGVDVQGMKWISIPFIPVHARASFAESFETNVHETESVLIPRISGINYENGRIFEVDGDSMEPTLITGERVFCEYVDPADWKYITGPVVVAFGNNMVVVKRIKENNLVKGELTLTSDNEIGGKITLASEQDQIRLIYKVKYTVYKPVR